MIKRFHTIYIEDGTEPEDVIDMLHKELKKYRSNGWLAKGRNRHILYHGGE